MDLACRFVFFCLLRRDASALRLLISFAHPPPSSMPSTPGMVPLPRKHNYRSVRLLSRQFPLLSSISDPFFLFLARSTHSYAFELTDLFTHERIMRLFPGHKMHLFGHSPDGVSLNLLLLHSSRLVQFADADLSTLSVLFFPGQVSSHLPPSTRVLSFGS